jgi:hypothetical protein
MGIWARNQVMRALPHLPGKEKVMGGIDAAASMITLKDYGSAVSVRP